MENTVERRQMILEILCERRFEKIDNTRYIDIDVENEMKDSFIAYAMAVNVSRAIPDVRDGLKPVHRRILWSMYESGYTPDKPHRKSATTVGYVMGHYHPHGDSAIYDSPPCCQLAMVLNLDYRRNCHSTYFKKEKN